ncbi:MAG TPA: SulP family inorganic anion transporter [Actinomycetota bacterium]|nr:SulP family inorganic anion transporter [Actinomycetota bacterium]
MIERRRSTGWLTWVAAGLIIGAVECVLAIAFASFVFGGGALVNDLPQGIGLYLGAAALTLAFFAWRSGHRGVVGSVQDAAAAVLSTVAGAVAVKVAELEHTAQQGGLRDFDRPDIFLTVVAATFLVTVLCGILFFVIGRFRLAALVRFVPYPVVGGFLAGTGWLLFKNGVNVSTGMRVQIRSVPQLFEFQLGHLIPAVVFGVVLLISVRVLRRPLVIPAVIAIGLASFVAWMVVTGQSIDEVRADGWLLFGAFQTMEPWELVTDEALAGADWASVLESWAEIAGAVLVATLAILFNISGTELVVGHDLDTNRELRDAGALNVVSGALGGIPSYHALSLSALGQYMKVDVRPAGLIAAAVPLAAVVFGATVIGLIPRMIVGGVLIFIGLDFLVEWVWDKRKLLPRLEYAVVVVILAGIIVWGFKEGVGIGLVLAVMLFVLRYGRIDLVREVDFGETYRSNVDRPATERAELSERSDRVQLLRVSGFVFFGSTSRLLERIRRRMDEATPPRFLVIDLRRVTGMDSSAVLAFVKVMRLSEAAGSEIVFTGASVPVREQLAQGGVVEIDGLVAFEPDLDRGLERCEDALLSAPGLDEAMREHPAAAGADGLPPGLAAHLERVSLEPGEVLLHQDDPPGDVYVLESGRLGVETVTPEGVRMRLRTLRPGVVVGEITLYTDVPRTADVVAEIPSVVLKIGRDRIERLEREQPELAAALHRWLATQLAERLTDTLGAVDALLD